MSVMSVTVTCSK